MIKKYALLRVIGNIIRESGEFSLRDVARKVKISPSTAKESLDFLFGTGVLDKRVLGRNHLFKIKNSFLTKQIKILYSLSELSSAGFAEELLKNNHDIISIMLYGSVARGEDDKKSDIDILVISRKNHRMRELKSEKNISRELTIISYTYKEWKKKAEEDKVFYYNVILNCIPLYGERPVVT